MRYSLLALAATSLLTGSASARGHAHRRHAHAHAELAPRFEAATNDECVCSTYVTSYLVDYTPPAPTGAVETGVPNETTTIQSVKTVVPIHEIDATSSVLPTSSEEITTTLSSTWTSTYTSTESLTASESTTTKATVPSAPPANVPTPLVTTIETPGVYTIPATTITLTNTEVVCVPETTSLAPGTQTYGGVTTVVATSTTVVCPLATVEVEDGVTTSKIYTTTYICPTAGTYTIGATTSTVTGTVTVPCEYPVPTAYPPGTYTQPEMVTTITVTKQVVTCPLFTAGPTSEPTTTAAAVTTTAAPAVPTTTATSAPASSIVATPVSSSSSSSSIAPSSSPIAGSGAWAITYSPYSDNGGCKTASEVEADIADIASKGISNVRIYSTDCSGLESVGNACEKHGVGIIQGVFIKAGGVSTGDSQVKDLLAWGKWNMVVMFVIGNEAVFNGYCSGAELAAYIKSVTIQVRAAGYNGPITTTEPLNIIQANKGTLCSAIDVVGVNIHPFFNSGVSADQAGEFLIGQRNLAMEACGGKEAWVLEAGWPSAGSPNGAAIPGKAEQATAIAAILKSVPAHIAMFTYRNDLWKDGGAFGVEQSFGCGELL